MKRPLQIILTLIIGIGFAHVGFSQKSLSGFIEDLRTTDEFTKSKIPIQAIKKGLSLGIRQYTIERGIQQLSNHITQGNYYMTEITDMEVGKITGILSGHKKKMIKHDHFTEWLTVENDDENVSVMILEKDNEISKVLVLSQLAGQIQLFEFTTRVSKAEFDKIFTKKELKRI